jgi:hypothetical protein
VNTGLLLPEELEDDELLELELELELEDEPVLPVLELDDELEEELLEPLPLLLLEPSSLSPHAAKAAAIAIIEALCSAFCPRL